MIERILRENAVDGASLLGFGDGYVEIQNIKAVGGVAVAVASDEAGRSGRPDPWKRDRLIGAGADIVIPDYRDCRAGLLGMTGISVEYEWGGRCTIMPFEMFDRSLLRLKPLAQRTHDMDRSSLIFPDSPRQPFEHESLPMLADRIVEAARNGRAVIFMCGAHVLKKGAGPLLADLIERGLLGHLALNGAGAIHDFEMALIGATTRKRRPIRGRGPIRALDRYRPDQRRRPRGPARRHRAGRGRRARYRAREVSLPQGERSGGRRAAKRAGHRPRRHRLGHHPRASRTATGPHSAPLHIPTS